jgi:hypothetical protein
MNGNSRTNLTDDQLSVLYAAYQKHKRTEPLHSKFKSLVNRTYSELCGGPKLHRATVKLHCDKWDAGGSHRSPRKKTPKKRPLQKTLTPAGELQLCADMKRRKLNYRGVARLSLTFESPRGGNVPVSRDVAARICKDQKLEMSFPKRRRIAPHTKHHKQARVSWTSQMAAKSDRFFQHLCASDEQSWSFELKPNSRNECFVVAPGTRSSTNISRFKKGDEHQVFSMWWTVWRGGVLAYELYEGGFTMDLYDEFLTDSLEPAVKKISRKRPPVRFSSYLHDAVSGRSAHDKIYGTLRSIFGRGRFCKHSQPPCKRDTGRVERIPVRRKGSNEIWYHRNKKVLVDCDPCECKFAPDDYPTSSPELNPAENAQNQLRQVVREALCSGEIKWKGNSRAKMSDLRKCIAKLNADKKYWRNLFDSLKARYKWVSENDGALLKN